MTIQRPKPEDIVVKLQQVEVLMGQGMPRIDATRQIGLTEQIYCRWGAGGQGTASIEQFSRQTIPAEWARKNSRN